MAKTVKIIRRIIEGNSKRVIADITCDNAYPAGGYPTTAADYELLTLDNVDIGMSNGGFVANFDSAASKLKIFKNAAGAGALAEIAATDVNGQVFRVEAVGNSATI